MQCVIQSPMDRISDTEIAAKRAAVIILFIFERSEENAPKIMLHRIISRE